MANNEERYIVFLEEILRKTKEKEISWKYLDGEQWLYKGMNWVKRYSRFGISGEQVTLRPGFDTENSFYCVIQGTYLVLLVQSDQPATFYIVPGTLKNVVILTADEYGALITRLLNIVRSFFPDGETFIDAILKEKKKD